MPFFWLSLLVLNTFWLVYNIHNGNAFMSAISAVGAIVSFVGVLKSQDDW